MEPIFYCENINELIGYKFSTGTTFYPNNGYVGINVFGDTCEGYTTENVYGLYLNSEYKDLSRIEKYELAEYMIKLWEKFRDEYS